MLNPDDMISCPLKPVHRVLRKRMAYHLIRCRQQFGDDNLANCPFNSAHIMPKMELNTHMTTCPNRSDALRGFCNFAEEEKTIPKAKAAQNFSWELGEEEWGAADPNVLIPERQITLGRNPYSYKPGAERRNLHLREVEDFKKKSTSSGNIQPPPS